MIEQLKKLSFFARILIPIQTFCNQEGSKFEGRDAICFVEDK